MSTRYMSSKWGPLGPIGVLASLESNSKVDSISHYRESTELQSYVNNNKILSARIYDLLYIVFSLPMN